MKLSDQVEAATGADRELDALIYLALHLPDWRKGSPWKKTNGWFKPDCATDAMAFFFHDGMGSHKTAPAYTASIDAALMLVPEGWSWSLGEQRGVGKFRGWLNDHNTPDGLAVRHVDADAATPALALCAAALRARGL